MLDYFGYKGIQKNEWRKPRIYNEPAMVGRPAAKEAALFGQRLAPLRKSKGMSQTQLAELMGTTRKMVDYYERRAVNPALDLIERTAQALEASTAELLGSEAKPERGKPGGYSTASTAV